MLVEDFQTLGRSRPPLGLGLGSWAILWLAVAAVGAVAFFWDGFASLAEAWARPEYSYGPIVPFITLYMALREIKHRPVLPDAGSRVPGLLFFSFGLLISLMGNLSEIPDFIAYGFIVAIGGLILIMAGTREGFRFWPGWLHLFFMLPLPNIVYWQASTKLQIVSSKLGVGFISLAGVPVYLDGNVIDLGSYQLLVAEACSGLRYLFPLFSFGWLFAVLYNGPNWHRAVLFLSVVPITVFMNSFRIGMIGVLVNYFGIGQAEGFLHVFEGWIIFVACTLVLYLEAFLLNRLLGGKAYAGHLLDVDFHGIIQPLRGFMALRANRTLVVACLLLAVIGVAWQTYPTSLVKPVERQSFASFPLSIGEWRGTPQLLDESIENVLRADDYFLTTFESQNQSVNLFLTFYDKQTGGSGIHSPEVCLPSGGWEVSQWTQLPVQAAGGPGFEVNRALIRKGNSRQLVYYWFEQRGRRMTNDYTAKLLSIWDRLTIGRSDGGLVRFVTPLRPGEREAQGDARLSAFLNTVMPMLPAYFPPRGQGGD